MMLLLALALLQEVPDIVLPPANTSEQRAILGLRRADDGRSLAQRFLCQDEERQRQLQELDERFARFRNLFSQTFGHGWQQDLGNSELRNTQSAQDLGRRDDCRLRDSFAAGLSEYQNGLSVVQSQLGIPR